MNKQAAVTPQNAVLGGVRSDRGGDTRLRNALPPRFEIEPFSSVAFAELAAHPLSPACICRNPGCSRPFNPTRSWSVYCCAGCREADTAEMRRIGLIMAPAMLAWRMGKNEKIDGDLRALSSAGRSFVGRGLTDWLHDRQRRVAEATHD